MNKLILTTCVFSILLSGCKNPFEAKDKGIDQLNTIIGFDRGYNARGPESTNILNDELILFSNAVNGASTALTDLNISVATGTYAVESSKY